MNKTLSIVKCIAIEGTKEVLLSAGILAITTLISSGLSGVKDLDLTTLLKED